MNVEKGKASFSRDSPQYSCKLCAFPHLYIYLFSVCRGAWLEMEENQNELEN